MFWTPAVVFEGRIIVESRGLAWRTGRLSDADIAIGSVVIDAEELQVPYNEYRTQFAVFRRVSGAIAGDCPHYGARVEVVEGWERIG